MRTSRPNRALVGGLAVFALAACAGSPQTVTVTVTDSMPGSASVAASEPVAASESASMSDTSQLTELIAALNINDVTAIEQLTVSGTPAREWSAIMAECLAVGGYSSTWSNELADGQLDGAGRLTDFTYRGRPLSELYTPVSGQKTIEDVTVTLTGAATGETNTWYALRIDNDSPGEVFIEFYGFSSGPSVLPFEFTYAPELPAGKRYEGCLRNPIPNPPTGELLVRWNFLDEGLQAEEVILLQKTR